MFQQFACVAAGAIGDFSAGEHAREFFDPAGSIEFVDAHRGATLERFFLDDEMVVGKARDLWLMRHT